VVKLDRAEALMLFCAGREKRIYAIPPHTEVRPLEFEDFKFRVEDFRGRACSRCGSAAVYLDETIDDATGRRLYTCSDSAHCARTRAADPVAGRKGNP
jgi:alpha-D-ribose 1-methylphosphonate 5-phosphate C-P lyase